MVSLGMISGSKCYPVTPTHWGPRPQWTPTCWGIGAFAPMHWGRTTPTDPSALGFVGVGTPMYWGGFRVDSPQRVGVDPNSLGHDEGPIPTALVGVF
jgi:hypothetical protein